MRFEQRIWRHEHLSKLPWYGHVSISQSPEQHSDTSAITPSRLKYPTPVLPSSLSLPMAVNGSLNRCFSDRLWRRYWTGRRFFDRVFRWFKAVVWAEWPGWGPLTKPTPRILAITSFSKRSDTARARRCIERSIFLSMKWWPLSVWISIAAIAIWWVCLFLCCFCDFAVFWVFVFV